MIFNPVFPNRSSKDVHSIFFRYQQKEHKRLRTEQRFLEMINQISKLTTLVKTLSEHVTNSRSNSVRNTSVLREDNAPKATMLSTLCDFESASL